MMRRILIALALTALGVEHASAAQQRTFVSGNGVDPNASACTVLVPCCTLSAPCRTFATAVLQTLAGGEVVALDSAGYGPVSISQSVTIVAASGVHAGISVPATGTQQGIDISGSATIVTLRGLTINSIGGGVGINFVNAKALTVERCHLFGFSSAGIFQFGGAMVVRDTTISDGPLSADGVLIYAGGATLDRVAISRTYNGVEVYGTAALAMRVSTINDVSNDGVVAVESSSVSLDGVTISRAGGSGVRAAGDAFGGKSYVQVIRSQIVGAGMYGLLSTGTSPGASQIHVSDSLVAGNGSAGVSTVATGQATISGNTIVRNSTGLFVDFGTLLHTFQNNQVRDNTAANINGGTDPLTRN